MLERLAKNVEEFEGLRAESYLWSQLRCLSSKKLCMADRPLSVKLSVKRRSATLLATTRQTFTFTETRPQRANPLLPDRSTIQATT